MFRCSKCKKVFVGGTTEFKNRKYRKWKDGDEKKHQEISKEARVCFGCWKKVDGKVRPSK